MTKLYVEEYARAGLAMGPGGSVMQAPEGPPLANYIIDYSGGEAHGAVVNIKCRILRLQNDSICVRQVGAAAVAATTQGGRCPAEHTEFLCVSKTDAEVGTVRVSAITTT